MTQDRLHDDFAFEPIPGLPDNLPEGESIVWQGTPEPVPFAVEVMRLRLAAALVAILVIWRTAAGYHDGIGSAAVFVVAGGTLLGGAIAMALLFVSGWLMARGTIYTLTNRRLVIRHGVAMPMAINVPFSKIETAALSEPRAGALWSAPSIALSLAPAKRMSFIALWPHARPFKLIRPEPALRAIVDGARVARLLSQALAQSAGQTPTVMSAPAQATPEPRRSDTRNPGAHAGIASPTADAV
jgi:Bacterial PH domain